MSEARARELIEREIKEMVRAGSATGLQVSVLRHGQPVVDAVAGLADPRTGAAVRVDTLFWAGSAAKGVASSLAHVLAERGELDYDLRVADVWPEFSAHGKGRITVRHILLHTAGVPALPLDVTVEELCHWERMCTALAAATPWWEPGSRFGYHAHTFGFLLGETLRRLTGRSIATLLRETITGPLGIADDLFFGVPRPHLARVAWQVASDGVLLPEPDPGTPQARAMPPGIRHDAAYANRSDVLTAAIPSEGALTARGVARLYAALLGHVDGVRLVARERLGAMAGITFTGIDEVMGLPTSWAFGYSPFRPSGSRPGSTFGMIGMTGSAAYADIESGVVVALMGNRFAPGDLSPLAQIDRVVADTLG